MRAAIPMIGDACQCGDVNDDGFVTGTDASAIVRACLDLEPWASSGRCQLSVARVDPFVVEKCDVGGPFTDGVCSGTDASIVRRAALNVDPPLENTCVRNLP